MIFGAASAGHELASAQVVQIENAGAGNNANPVNIPGDVSQTLNGQSNGGGGDNGSNAFLTGTNGDGGGSGGTVTVNTSGTISTSTPNAAAIFVQSSGGKGGNGGNSDVVGTPGNGGSGGAGNTVSVTNTANISAFANGGTGIAAISVGGAGGNGGTCGAACFPGDGGGGPSGRAGAVTVTSDGILTTAGASKSFGIYAQSIGGAGGAGGSSTFFYLVGYAAGAQSGGDGGTVNVNVDSGSITTQGTGSSAIYAQSIGGGGGSGGTGIGLLYASGGSGTAGGVGNTVTVNNSADLVTIGNQSSGIYAQSVGGGGGAGGGAGGIGVTFGGVGGAGQNGGVVDVHNHGMITVHGSGDFNGVSSASLAAGIFAQSVGGGGGDGGITVAGLANFGGKGGGGGTGAAVSVENTATIQTICGVGCTGGTAIFAQSVGGGGGNGGGAFGVLSFGGTGGGGGDGATVTVNNSGNLTTTSQFSDAIFAQSVGGGGGNGAFAGGIAAIGGSGGEGGIGHTVTVNNNANIKTSAADSAGIFAQSVGGGGGNGGGSLGLGAFVSFALGGKGGAGGNGGTVCINTANGFCGTPLAPGISSIETSGDRSTGILAQSVGGGGGNGGFAFSASVGLYGDVSIGVGGKGGGAGTGGDVYVADTGSITTGSQSSLGNTGQFSDGIDAESIGGGGGNGGFSIAAGVSTGGAVSASLAGNGGMGNKSGTVTVNTHADVTTYGDQAVAIFARSIGGGGGNGGFAVSVAGSPYASIGLSFGGAGGGGAQSDAVSVDNVGTIQTFGALSNGISAQSIGGGGGNGGFSVAAGISISTGGAASLSFGGGGGSGSESSTVHVGSHGDINTHGTGSMGILAQSIGGGGGNGGFSGAIALSAGAAFSDSFGGGGGTGNHAGAVDVTSTGSITTTQDNSIGIEAQSIGGGGGNGGFSLSAAATLDAMAIGKGKAGDGGTGGYGSLVTVTSNGTIRTGGSLAYGILAQSIGGGGGNGSFAIGGALSESGPATGNSVGGNGGTGNFADAVTVTTNTLAGSTIPGTVIFTTGTGAIGILAQSIGGGGGNGGFAINLNASLDDNAGDNTLGAVGAAAGAAGAASDGGIVEVNNNGTIVTTGATAHGIVAQSIGGGGGTGGFAIAGAFSAESNASSNSIGGKGGTGGSGKAVTVTNKGDIHVSGDMADAIIAQSIGGGGGNGGFSVGAALSIGGKSANNTLGGAGGNGGTSGEVDVFNSNVITVGGGHSDGILAQSIGGGGGNGGFSVGASGAVNGSDGANDTVGGSGGSGGNGGIVKVQTFAGSSITTSGLMDHGIQAQSIGGGGGNGGFNISGSFSSDGDAKSSVGGSKGPGVGGGGGDGVLVTVDNAGDIDTQQASSIGILAQSIGGGGGNGGFSISAGVSLNGSAAANAVGGTGGNGGNGGQVIVINDGVVHTEQANSIGISAQSIGGGGGNGGFAIAGTFTAGSQATVNSVGGRGGHGGYAVEVDVTNNRSVQVDAAHSTGILAQSIGGGGGNGGFAIGAGISVGSSKGASDTVGGSGGNGGASGIVNVTNAAGSQVSTGGPMDFGIVAQSIGGGGGNGGFTMSASFSLSGDAKTNVGGSCDTDCKTATGTGSGPGAGGGDASTVTVKNDGLVQTTGASSIGIVAQSIGGGGGTGGFAGSAGVSIDGAAGSNSIGGAGGNGGAGGQVVVINQTSGIVHTLLSNSIGIEAQSIGGGGGNGGFSIAGAFTLGSGALANAVGGTGGNGGIGGQVDVTNDHFVQVDAAHSIGILAQSIGGGGGNGGFAIGAGASVGSSTGATDTVGGSGGNGGAGGIVNVTTGAGSQVVTAGAMDFGIIAQSIGGGGGNGGFTLSGSFALSGDAKTNVGGSCDAACQIKTGGTGSGVGGGGGDAHKVTVDNFGLVQTDGASSTGIVAQSIGGGGGNGGFAGGLAISTGGNSTSTAIGGIGGAGGAGGEVKVTNESGGFVHTQQANSIGILAQSIGGGGGGGGFAISASGSTGSGSSTTVGGAGGAGGGGGLVTVINHGLVETDQVLSAGIVAQSIGGGGGNGGFSVNGTLSSGSGGMSSGVGGTGGLGGAGGTVIVTNDGAIGAFKDGSIGILAQSIGGGGGSGGFSGAVAIGGSLRNNVGGAGGAGGSGGDVTVTSTGSITTVGANSVAVVAQSIGGGGGAGGFAISVSSGTAPSADLTIGGLAATLPTVGVTGTSGTVIVNIASGTLHTTGQLATAALIQAIGGGGGIGGLVVGDPMTLGAAGSTLKVGGQAPLTGDGTALNPTNSSAIAADMAGSMGLVVQSIGGGGGVGQVAGDYDLANSTLSALVGGSGVLTGLAPLTNNGADSTPSNTANVTTQGDNGIGLLSQSIGGGGGVADFSFGSLTGAAAAIVLDLGGSQTTAGNGAHASFSTQGTALTTGNVAPYAIAQSIGGGGGFAGFVADQGIAVGAGGLTFNLGSSVANLGGAGGSAGLADIVDAAGSITTTGFASPALVAQSIGGGGGFAGFYNGGTTGVAFSGLQLGTLGGSGAGSAVTATSAATILTQKDGSFGVLAQSIGGGGGAAIAAGVSGSGPASIGASNGAGGSGGTVGVTTTAAIRTEGVGAHAIVAQSIGGGGGLFLGVDPTGGLLAPQVQATAGGAGGNGAAVTVQNSAIVATTGAAAYGVIAQSIGGGGGFIGSGNVATNVPLTGGFAGSVGGAGSAGTVSVEAAASIVTTGADATAIFAQSTTSTGRGSAIDVIVDSDAMIIGGSGTGHAVRLEGGAANLLDNRGLLTTRAGIDGLTIVGGLGDEAVVNTGSGPLTLGLNDVPGLVVGSVDLGAGANSFDNKATGIFDSGAFVKLGAGNLLTNEGLLSPGAYLRVLPTNITGNFAQTASGIYGLDVDFQNQTTDRVNVTGTASVKGVVNVDILNPGLSAPGSHESTIVSAQGGVTHSNLALMALSTAVAKYVLTYPNSHDIDLKFSIDFAPSGLTPNQTAVGQAINNIQTARASPNFAPIAAALFYQPDLATLRKIYDSISGEGVAGYEDAAFSQNDLFMSTISRQMDFWRTDDRFDPNAFVAYSPIAHGVAEDPSFVQSRTWRAWISGYGGGAQVAHDYTVGGAGVKAVGEGFSVGLDYQITPNVILGVAGGAGPSGFNVSDRATSGKIDAAHGAIYSAARWGSYYASGILGYDSFNVSENRYAAIPGSNLPIVAVPGFSEALHGHFQSDSISSRIETGYRRQYRSFGVTPFAAFQFSALTMHGSTETQANYTPSTIGLVFSNRAIHSLPSFLGAKFETQFAVGNGVTITSWVNVSWMHEFNPFRGLTASFIAAPGFPFSVQSANPSRDSARLEAGLGLPLDQTASLFAGFNGSLAARSASYAGTGGIRFAW